MAALTKRNLDKMTRHVHPELDIFKRSNFEVFDDFLGDTIATTGVDQANWIVFAGTDGDAAAAAIGTRTPEGTITMGSGDDGS